MNVRELIMQLLNEDMDAGCYVVVDTPEGDKHFAIDGIATFRACKGKGLYWAAVTLETTDI